MAKGIINAFDHMELGLVLDLTKDGNQAVIGYLNTSIFAARYVSFAAALYTR